MKTFKLSGNEDCDQIAREYQGFLSNETQKEKDEQLIRMFMIIYKPANKTSVDQVWSFIYTLAESNE